MDVGKKVIVAKYDNLVLVVHTKYAGHDYVSSFFRVESIDDEKASIWIPERVANLIVKKPERMVKIPLESNAAIRVKKPLFVLGDATIARKMNEWLESKYKSSYEVVSMDEQTFKETFIDVDPTRAKYKVVRLVSRGISGNAPIRNIRTKIMAIPKDKNEEEMFDVAQFLIYHYAAMYPEKHERGEGTVVSVYVDTSNQFAKDTQNVLDDKYPPYKVIATNNVPENCQEFEIEINPMIAEKYDLDSSLVINVSIPAPDDVVSCIDTAINSRLFDMISTEERVNMDSFGYASEDMTTSDVDIDALVQDVLEND